MITTMNHTSDFLNGLGKLSKAFSVHEKHAQYSVKNLTEAVALKRECIAVLGSYVDSIKEKNEYLPKVLNGPEGGISNKSYDSIKLLEWIIMELKSNLDNYGNNDVNLLSSMTLDTEHLQSTVNYKQGFQTMLQYARSFASSIKESLKSLTQWSTHYFISKDSWYHLPENSINFKDIKMPAPLTSSKNVRRKQCESGDM